MDSKMRKIMNSADYSYLNTCDNASVCSNTKNNDSVFDIDINYD